MMSRFLNFFKKNEERETIKPCGVRTIRPPVTNLTFNQQSAVIALGRHNRAVFDGYVSRCRMSQKEIDECLVEVENMKWS